MSQDISNIVKLKIEHTVYPILAAVFSFILAISYADSSFSNDVNYFRSFGYGKGARDEITVVHIDDKFIADLKRLQFMQLKFVDWPLPYVVQAALINRILKLQPKAVFIDLSYGNQRQSDAELAPLIDSFDQARHAGPNGEAIPFFLAAVQDTEQTADQTAIKKIHLPLTAFDGKVNPVLAGWDGLPGRYPLSVEIKVDGNGDDDGKIYHSAAFALYRTLCGAHCSISTEHSEDPSQALAIQWANRETSFVGQTHDANDYRGCQAQEKNWWERIQALVTKKLNAFREIKNTSQILCSPVNTVHASSFFDQERYGDLKQIKRMIEGRVVLIGASTFSSEDITPTPTHGLQPGVYLHAMALDNLLSYGKDYPRDTVFHAHIEIYKPFIFELAIFVLALWFRHSAMNKLNKKHYSQENTTIKPLEDKQSYEESVVKIEYDTFKLAMFYVAIAIMGLRIIYQDISFFGLSVIFSSYLMIVISLIPKLFKKKMVNAINGLINLPSLIIKIIKI